MTKSSKAMEPDVEVELLEKVRERGVGVSAIVKATSHSTIFDIPMRPLREDQKHRHRFTR